MKELHWYQVEGRKYLHLSDGTRSYPLCLSSQAPLYYADKVPQAPRHRVCETCERVAERLGLKLPPINERDRGRAERDSRTMGLQL